MSTSLPEDYPHREAFIAGGVVTRAQVRAASDQKLIKKVPSLAGDGIKAVRAYEEAHPETPSASVAPAPSQQGDAEASARAAAEEAARKAAEAEAQRREQEEHARIAREELEREEAARLQAQTEARQRAEEEEQRRADEERARSQQPRRVRVKVENLGPNRLKEGTITDDPQVVSLLDKPYGHKLVEEVEES
jgi:hypothetical protein